MMVVQREKVKGVLFDFGNTLFAHAPLAMTIGEAAGRLGLQIGEDDLVALARRIDSAAMAAEELAYPRDLHHTVWKQRWQVLYGMADEWGAGLGEAINASMHAPAEWIPYPQSMSTLRVLHAGGLAVGIVSNTGWNVRDVFTEHAVADAISSFTLSYEAGFVKPDPRIFEAACESLGLTPADVVMVGDDPVADSGAVRAGIHTLLLPAVPPRVDNGVADVLKLVGLETNSEKSVDD
jgi:HAD superfamily hydrolase (TIGR01509 family)